MLITARWSSLKARLPRLCCDALCVSFQGMSRCLKSQSKQQYVLSCLSLRLLKFKPEPSLSMWEVFRFRALGHIVQTLLLLWVYSTFDCRLMWFVDDRQQQWPRCRSEEEATPFTKQIYRFCELVTFLWNHMKRLVEEMSWNKTQTSKWGPCDYVHSQINIYEHQWRLCGDEQWWRLCEQGKEHSTSRGFYRLHNIQSST